MNAIHDLIRELDVLEPIPAIVNQILAAVENPDCDIKKVASLIEYEPSITANLLKTCNSAYFNLPQRIESVQDAAKMLGMDHIVRMVLMNAAGSQLNRSQSGYGLEPGALWKHAVASALITREIAVHTGETQHQTLFTAALLKDIGKIALNRFIEDYYPKIRRLVDEKGYTFREAEKAVIGIDHAELGGMIARRWKFPETIETIIRLHHLPTEDSRKDRKIAIVYVADSVCMMMGIGIGADGLAYRFYKDVLKMLNIQPLDLQRIIADFGEKMGQVEALVQSSAT